MSEKKLPAITDDVIADLKLKHKKIFKYDTEDGRSLIFRNPTIAELEASSVLAASKPMQSNKVIAKACAVAGDDSIIDDDATFLGLSAKLKDIIVRVQGELTEL